MNEVLMRMRKRNKITQAISQYPHLSDLLEAMTQNVDELSVAEIHPVMGSITIKFAEDGERIRKVVRRSNSRMTGKFPSRKNGRMMQWESKYELETFQILEISPLVAAYSEQPAEIKYSGDDGIEHRHYPDILVVLRSGIKMFIEVKPESAITDQDLADRTRLIASLLRHKGYQYVMVLPEQVVSFAYLENAKHLLLYSKMPMPESAWEMVRRILLREGSIELANLIKSLKHADARSWIYRLLIAGDILCDLSEPITNQTLMRWNYQGAV